MASKAVVALRQEDVGIAAREHAVQGRAVEQFLRACVTGALQPDMPTNIIIPEKLRENAVHFLHAFPAGTKHMYAVKANPAPEVIDRLYSAGITHFDVASREEISLVRSRHPEAVLYFMHPVKSPRDIDFAMRNDVKGYVVDDMDELDQLTGHPQFDAEKHSVIVRIAAPKAKKGRAAVMPLDRKFGADKTEAMALLRACAAAGIKDIGMSFHVGSQTMHPENYADAIRVAASYAKKAGVQLSSLDVGGGFPAFAAYPHINGGVPALEFYVAQIKRALQQNGLSDAQLLTEPGRALVADAGILITQGRVKRNGIHLNDGVFGGLFDAGAEVGFRYPTFAFNKLGQMLDGHAQPQALWGPTCDSHDRLAGQWNVPAQFQTGDFMAFELMGAYSEAMRTRFNGVGQSQTLVLR